MLARLLGVPAAFMMFFFVAGLASNVVSSGTPLLAGLTVGAVVWYCFTRLDRRRFERALNPKPQLWPVPMPVAWGVVKDIFDGSTVSTNAGLVPWVLLKHDQSRGIITAMLNTRELSGTGQGMATEPRTITVAAVSVPEGRETLLKLRFDVFSPADTKLVQDIITTTQSRIRAEISKYGLCPSG